MHVIPYPNLCSHLTPSRSRPAKFKRANTGSALKMVVREIPKEEATCVERVLKCGIIVMLPFQLE